MHKQFIKYIQVTSYGFMWLFEADPHEHIFIKIDFQNCTLFGATEVTLASVLHLHSDFKYSAFHPVNCFATSKIFLYVIG